MCTLHIELCFLMKNLLNVLVGHGSCTTAIMPIVVDHWANNEGQCKATYLHWENTCWGTKNNGSLSGSIHGSVTSNSGLPYSRMILNSHSHYFFSLLLIEQCCDLVVKTLSLCLNVKQQIIIFFFPWRFF